MARRLVRICALPRRPHDELGFRLNRLDGWWFDLAVLSAADAAGDESVDEMIRGAQSIEAVTAGLLRAILIEG